MSSDSNKRIAKNTIALYLRTLLSVIVSLYTSRVVLQVLGVSDYGVYGVVGGIVGMFTFLNSAMSAATSRFLTFEMGKGDDTRLNDTFNGALLIHIGIAFVVVLIAETVGLWLLCNKMVIPEGRMTAAHVVYQCSIVASFLGITQVPYSAVIMAHEKMDIYAYIELLNVGLKLVIVYLITIAAWDKLIVYSLLSLAVSVLMIFIYRFYCIKHYKESRLHLVFNKKIVKPMLGFSVWNLLAECGYSLRVYGSNVVLNMFFGTVVNAAGGIAATVQGILMMLAGNITTAVRPQIITNYAAGNFQRMNQLMVSTIRMNLFLVGIVTIPMFIDAPYVLKLWLGNVPEYCVSFCRLLLVVMFITGVSHIITIGLHASGKIRRSAIVRNIIYMLTPVAIYGVLKWHHASPVVGYSIIVVSQTTVALVDIYLLHQNIPQIKCSVIFFDYIKSLVIAAAIVFGVGRLMHGGATSFGGLVIDSLVGWLCLVVLFWLLMFREKEKNMVVSFVTTTLSKISNR